MRLSVSFLHLQTNNDSRLPLLINWICWRHYELLMQMWARRKLHMSTALKSQIRILCTYFFTYRIPCSSLTYACTIRCSCLCNVASWWWLQHATETCRSRKYCVQWFVIKLLCVRILYNICMYVWMYVCIYVCMYVYMYVCALCDSYVRPNRLLFISVYIITRMTFVR
jgi:hypothetical protein